MKTRKKANTLNMQTSRNGQNFKKCPSAKEMWMHREMAGLIRKAFK